MCEYREIRDITWRNLLSNESGGRVLCQYSSQIQGTARIQTAFLSPNSEACPICPSMLKAHSSHLHTLTESQFNLRGCIRVGVLDSPLALPSDEEIITYKYGPSTIARPIPVPENDFLHRFHKEDPRHHTFRLSDLPHKLDESITSNRDPNLIQRGWGVHLVEGTDIFNVGRVTVVTALMSFLVAFIWWGVTSDAQTAFTVAGFLVATQGMVIGGTVMVLENL